MKLLILILVALGVAIAAAQLVSTTGPGYVLLSLKGWTVELSLTMFVAIIVIAFIALYLALRLLAGLWKTPKKVGNWRKDRLKTKAARDQTHGMMELIEGNWPKAEKRLLR
ncbi:MAG: heme biosynthesis protein HemY, partial [Gammaproteobacteria bacterium]|nr:heme biosynthesis protein HemY [Gammaproteobacteria bacterium]